MESPFIELENEISYLRRMVEVLGAAVPVWKSIEEDGLPKPGLEHKKYIIALELQNKHNKNDIKYEVDSAMFVIHPSDSEYVIDKHWIPCFDWDEGYQIIRVTHWVEFPVHPKTK